MTKVEGEYKWVVTRQCTKRRTTNDPIEPFTVQKTGD